MGLRDSATHAVRWASFGWVATQVIAFVTSIITARLLAPELFGLITLILVIVSAASIFADAGTRAALVQFEDPIDDVVSTALLVVPVVGALAATAMASLSWLIADFYDEPRLGPLAIALSGLLFLQSIQIVPDALLQRRFDLRLRRGVLDPSRSSSTGSPWSCSPCSGPRSGASSSASTSRRSPSRSASGRSRGRGSATGTPSVRTWRRIGKYGRHLLLANFIEVINSQGPPVALGRNVSPTAVGLYGAGSRLSSLPITGITHVAGQVIFPALSRLQADAERLSCVSWSRCAMISLLTSRSAA